MGPLKSVPHLKGRLPLCFALGLCLSLASVHAGAPPLETNRSPSNQTAPRLDEVVVTGTRLGEGLTSSSLKVQVLSRQQIWNSGAARVSEVLTSVPGVATHEHGNQSQVAMQGLDSKYVKILVDGMAQSGSVAGGFPLDLLSLSSVERIEIAPGASSSQYGSEAMAGVIQLFTRRRGANPGISMAVEARGDTTGFLQTGLRFSHQGPHSTLNLGASFRLEDGRSAPQLIGGKNLLYYDIPFRQVMNLSGSFETRWASGFTVIRLRFGAQDLYSTAPHPSLTGSYSDQTNLEAHLQGEQQMGPVFRLRWEGAYKSFETETTDLNLYFKTQSSPSPQTFSQWQGELRGTFEFGPKALLDFGIQPTREELKYASIRGTNQGRSSLGSYAQMRLSLGKKDALVLTPAARLEGDPALGFQPTASFHLRAKFSEKYLLRLGWGYNFRTPTLKDAYYQWVHPAPANFLVLGNPNLKPETGHSLNFQTEARFHPAVNISLGAFQHLLKDQIGFGPQVPGEGVSGGIPYSGVILSSNIDRSQTWGVQIEIKGAAAPLFSYSAGWAFTQGEMASGETGAWLPLPLIAPHQVRLAMGLTAPVIKTHLALAFQWNSPVLLDASTGEKTPNLFRFDANLAQPIGQWLNVTAGVRNLLGTVYRDGYFQEGRVFHLGLRMQWDPRPPKHLTSAQQATSSVSGLGP